MRATKFRRGKSSVEYRRGALSKHIVRLVADGVAMEGMAAVAPNTQQLIEYFDPNDRLERNRIWKSIKYLETMNRIRLVKERDGKVYVYLTHLGKKQLSEAEIDELAVPEPRRWDHKWRLVMFDIPSSHERVRQPFRTKLEDMGFLRYQRSVLIYPYECHEEIYTIAKWYGVDEYVRYIVATELHDMRAFVQLFDLL